MQSEGHGCKTGGVQVPGPDVPKEEDKEKSKSGPGGARGPSGQREMRRRLSIHSDGYAWVKYGEKSLAPTGTIREYYKCRNWRSEKDGGTSCPARKVVDKPCPSSTLPLKGTPTPHQSTPPPPRGSSFDQPSLLLSSPSSPSLPPSPFGSLADVALSSPRTPSTCDRSAGCLLPQLKEHNHPPPERLARRKTPKANESGYAALEASGSCSREEGVVLSRQLQESSKLVAEDADSRDRAPEAQRSVRESSEQGLGKGKAKGLSGVRSFWAELEGWVCGADLQDSTGQRSGPPPINTKPTLPSQQAEVQSPGAEAYPELTMESSRLGPPSPESPTNFSARKLPTLVIPETVEEGEESSGEMVAMEVGDDAICQPVVGGSTPMGEVPAGAASMVSPLACGPSLARRQSLPSTPVLQGRQGDLLVSPRLKLPRICTAPPERRSTTQSTSAGASPGSFPSRGLASAAASSPSTPADAQQSTAAPGPRQVLPNSFRKPPVSPLSSAPPHKDFLSTPFHPPCGAPASASAPATPFSTWQSLPPPRGTQSFCKPPVSPGTLGTLLGALGPISGRAMGKTQGTPAVELQSPVNSHRGSTPAFCPTTQVAQGSSQLASMQQGQGGSPSLAHALLEMLGVRQANSGSQTRQEVTPEAAGQSSGSGVGVRQGSPCSPATFCAQQLLSSPPISSENRHGDVGGREVLLRSVIQALSGSTSETSGSTASHPPFAPSLGSPSTVQSSQPSPPLSKVLPAGASCTPAGSAVTPGVPGIRVKTSASGAEGSHARDSGAAALQALITQARDQHNKEQGRDARRSGRDAGTSDAVQLMQKLLGPCGDRNQPVLAGGGEASRHKDETQATLLGLVQRVSEGGKSSSEMQVEGGEAREGRSEEVTEESPDGLASAVLPLLQELRRRLVRQALEGMLRRPTGPFENEGNPAASLLAALQQGSAKP